MVIFQIERKFDKKNVFQLITLSCGGIAEVSGTFSFKYCK